MRLTRHRSTSPAATPTRTLECFTVAPATIDIAKVANPAGPVSAGDSIGFDITVTNTGTGTALNVAVNDPLPPGINWTLGTVTAGASCAITGPVGSRGPRLYQGQPRRGRHLQRPHLGPD